MLLASSSIDAVNAIAALLGGIGTLLGATVSVYTTRVLVQTRKSGGNGGDGGSSGKANGGDSS